MYEPRLDEILELLKKNVNHGSRVFLQLPEGLKKKAQIIVEGIEKKGYEVVVDIEPCFGACDVPVARAKVEGCDVVLHLGHTPILELDSQIKEMHGIKVVYYPVHAIVDLTPLLERAAGLLERGSKVSVATTIQFHHVLESITEELKKQGFTPLIGKSARTGLEGVVLGCDYAAMKKMDGEVMSHLFIAGGEFHVKGAIREVNKSIVHINPERNEVKLIGKEEREKIMRREMLLVEKFKEAEKIGILTSTKLGQRFGDPFKVKRAVEKLGKKCFVLSGDLISREKLEGLDVDFYIILACPRLEEDTTIFSAPAIAWGTLVKHLKITGID